MSKLEENDSELTKSNEIYKKPEWRTHSNPWLVYTFFSTSTLHTSIERVSDSRNIQTAFEIKVLGGWGGLQLWWKLGSIIAQCNEFLYLYD